MRQQRANQLGLKWNNADEKLPQAVREEVRALVAQLLRAVVEAERREEETDGE